MKRSIIALIAITLVIVFVGIVESQQVNQRPRTRSLLKLFAVGQAAAIKDAGFNVELTDYPDAKNPLGYTVIEVADDYVVLRNLTGNIDTAIPTSSIKSVSTFRLQMPQK